MKLAKRALLWLTIAAFAGACQGCAGADREEIPAPGCELRVRLPAEALDEGAAALARINAAAGCEVEASDAGVPLGVVETLQMPDGKPSCGQTSIARYADGALNSIVKIEIATQVEGCNSMEAIIIHEIFHAMIATNDEHASHGVFHAFSGNGELIDDASLTTLCTHIACPSFVPEG